MTCYADGAVSYFSNIICVASSITALMLMSRSIASFFKRIASDLGSQKVIGILSFLLGGTLLVRRPFVTFIAFLP